MNLTPPPARVFDVTEENFETDVLQASMDTPILLDFWAEWCGPCKALGPILEKLAKDYQGAFRLGKIDVDKQQALAGAFGIRSIPTVMLFQGGKPVDGFTGALSEGQLRQFLAQHLPPSTETEPAEADAAATAESPAQAIERLRKAMAAEPDKSELRLDLIQALLQDGQADEAATELDQLPAELASQPRTQALRGGLEMARELDGAPPLEDLRQRVAKDSGDWAARDLLGVRLLLAGDPGAGLEQFLHILEHARDWQDGKARQRLLSAFAIVDDPTLVGQYRRRMASLLF